MNASGCHVPVLCRNPEPLRSAVIDERGEGGRLVSAAGIVEEFLSRNAAWAQPFIEQIITFPAGRHDDMADTMSQAATWLLLANVSTVGIYNAFTGRPFD